MRLSGPLTAGLLALALACAPRPIVLPQGDPPATPNPAAPGATVTPAPPVETDRHFGRVWQLTHGGQNAEAYFSADGRRIIYQHRRAGEIECDQIFTMDLNGAGRRMVSTGEGRTTCGYYFPPGDRVLFSSTHHVDRACPAPPDRSRGYVWPILAYDVFTARPDGSDLRRLTDNPGYDAEATISPDGRSIVFTSHRDGDIDIYVMNADGSNVRRLTNEFGYDGGPFFSPDGTKIVYRAHHPTDSAAIADYRALLAAGLVRPNRVDIFVMNADGSGKRQLTDNGKANFAPFFHPDGRRIIFSSNVDDPSGRAFSLYMIDSETSQIERITQGQSFDGFPMFTADGRLLMFASTRNAAAPGDINIFIAEWRD
jgi:TolB protein